MLFRRAELAAALATAAAALSAVVTVADGAAARRDPPVPPARAPYAVHFAAYQKPAPAAEPADNASTPDRQALGKRLFFDPQLSGTGRVSCASCHDPSYSWTDRRARAVGAPGVVLARRTPTILNTAWAAALMWDGRAESLEQQALGPIEAAGEMSMPLPQMERRLNASATYRAMFRRAYGADTITAAAVGRALAAFQRGVVSTPAPFDRWVAGDDRAVSEQAKRGFLVFNGKGGCANCHGGWRFTDDSFHDVGVGADAADPDSGRAKIIPGVEALAFAFKTPTLRNVADRAPYMHDGSERTLEQVVELYDRGGRVRRASVAAEVKPLGLTADERGALVAFLRTLSSRDTVTVPGAATASHGRPAARPGARPAARAHGRPHARAR